MQKLGDPKSIVLRAFKDVVEARFFDQAAIELCFSENYKQCVDGKILKYSEFLEHLRKQKERIAEAKVTIIEMISEKSIVFTNHEVDVVAIDGARSKFKVIAQFTVLNGKIVACDELTRMISGTKDDQDLGSRH